jgi:hypothetical protein
MLNLDAYSAKMKASKEKKGEKGVPFGKYQSMVTSVQWAEGYKAGTAFVVKYALGNEAGEKFSFKELFFNETTNSRTAEFLAYLADNGIDDLADFEGCLESIEIGKNVKNSRIYRSIIEREFLTVSETDVEVTA